MSYTSVRFENLQSAVQELPLVEINPSLEGLNPALAENNGGAIYYGTGIATPRELTVGLPFDVLGMMLTAEKLRQAGNFDTVYHHIADTHASTNQGLDENEVGERAREIISLVSKIRSNLGLDQHETVIASSFDNKPEYLNIFDEVTDITNLHEYLTREIADIEWYSQHRDVRLKLGWTMANSSARKGNDERLPDQEYSRILKGAMSFIYTRPGMTFDNRRPRVSPYITVEGETRLRLSTDEDTESVFQSASKSASGKLIAKTGRHLSDIVTLYEVMYGDLGNIDMSGKLQRIIDASVN